MLVSEFIICYYINIIIIITKTLIFITIEPTEWPVYFEGRGSNRKKTYGNVNIVRLALNVIDYTVILELYSFKDSALHLKRIGQKLAAIFSLNVACVTGCRHLSDYTKLKKQYPEFHLPFIHQSKLDDVSIMAINRGIVRRGKNNSTLQALCKKENMYLPKPANVCVGTCFASQGTLSQEALKYCQLDVEVCLTLHGIYSGKPDLTMRVNRMKDTRKPAVGDLVDIMPETSKAVDAIAQGVITQIGGTWASNLMKLRSNQLLVEVKKVFNRKGIIHYPCDGQTKKKCRCKRLTHGNITNICDFYLYSQHGPPSFVVPELNSRLRFSSDDIQYPACIYEDENEEPITNASALNFSLGEQEDQEPTEREDPEDSDSENEEEPSNSDPLLMGIPQEILQYFDDEEFESDGDDGDEGFTEDPQATPEQIRMATEKEFSLKLEELLEEADRMSENETQSNNNTTNPDNLPNWRTVLGDPFHFMDRAKLPMHHQYKSLFFLCLRAAMFIMVKEDVDDVKQVLKSKGESWEKMMAFNFDYIAKRVRRRIPPPDMLYNRMRVVYDFFKDKVDTKTKQKKLFSERNKHKFECMLDLVKKGYASDPPGVHLYLPKTDSLGRQMRDKDGLPLYRSLRGTSNLESLHQYLTTSFGHTMAGPLYSDSLLCVLRHNYNWRMSRKNRQHFPQLMHYDGLLIDRINRLYEGIYGYKKYVSWEAFNDNIATKSVFGIVEVDKDLTSSMNVSDDDIKQIKQNKTLQHLAKRQGTPVPFLPIRYEKEKRLVHQKLNEAIANEESLSNESVFERIAKDWNAHHISVANKIYPKMPFHFAQYVKSWQKNQNIRDAAVASGANKVADVMEYVPELNIMPNFEAVPLAPTAVETDFQPPPNFSTTDSNAPTDTEGANSNLGTEAANPDGLSMLCEVVEAAAPAPPPVEMQPTPATKKRTRIRTCQGTWNKKTKTGQHCPNPTTCVGMNGRANCELRTGGDPSKKTKRTVVSMNKKKCSVCGLVGCNGVNLKSRCKNTPLRRNT